MNLKDITVSVFSALATDEELLSMLEVPTRNMKDIRVQIIEDKYPDDLITDNLTRLCVYERPSARPMTSNIEEGGFEVDIYITKEKNKVDRRVLQVAERLINLLDSERRKKLLLPTLQAGLGIRYQYRLSNMQTDSMEWIKFGLVFSYNMIRL